MAFAPNSASQVPGTKVTMSLSLLTKSNLGREKTKQNKNKQTKTLIFEFFLFAEQHIFNVANLISEYF